MSNTQKKNMANEENNVVMDKSNNKAKRSRTLYTWVWITWALTLGIGIFLFIKSPASHPWEENLLIAVFCLVLVAYVAYMFCAIALLCCLKHNQTLCVVMFVLLGWNPLTGFIFIIAAISGLPQDSQNADEVFNDVVNDGKSETKAKLKSEHDIESKLAKLESLRTIGLIDDEDYAKLKNDIIRSSI